MPLGKNRANDAELRAEKKSFFKLTHYQILKHRLDGGQDSSLLGENQSSYCSDNSKSHMATHTTRLSIIQDNSTLLLLGQGNSLCFAIIKHHFQCNDQRLVKKSL